ncbi:adenosylcobalamin-dependent ribonucleoside-diphosphate reductase [Sneathiella sp. P13V-1]|uniref:adenosylcobalamin-dependent ribonucleoside-diphosphate reductase n=1 Tax=Sneathiella sp. P13V-1 TaxID=2697366 RepID=UPI00187B44CE|nr:adenosylcobalamin-dependent ribonucleoside-diphosphate reductase [Sneathiella sp. P13V-1]MBE7635673.1 adenosylcobalamin-dependent ribonucleoside-diphosphate reductase [Sneathiella sp. P13V-1]
MASIAPISQQIWDMKYRFRSADGQETERSIEDTWARIAHALAEPEDDPDKWQEIFYKALEDYKFLPAGRIVAGAGTKRNVTLFNCFVMGNIPDDMAGIFDNLKEAAVTMQQGGGIGYNFSTIRPKGAPVKSMGSDASGPLSFMDVWDSMCRTIMSAGSRRGAMMATLRCDHPDILDFIRAKQDPGRLRMFNLSVLVTDDFMEAVKSDGSWDLVFEGTHFKTLRARELWDEIMRSTYSYAEPGVIFIDRINKRNNLYYCEDITATNPCGEQPLPAYGACLLGSVNLTRFVKDPFSSDAALDLEALDETVRTAIRMMDNVVDVSNFPLEEQRHEAKAKRRIGLGITGLADALIMCGVRYGSDEAISLTRQWLSTLRRSAYLASTDLAKEKGAFPLYDEEAYLSGETVKTLEPEIQGAIKKNGIRNALVTSVAPTGTISLLADNISSGLEPVFSFSYTRNVLMPDGTRKSEEVSDYALRLFRRLNGEDALLPDYFVDAQILTPEDHVKMQAVVQDYIDSSISKTINCPEDISFDQFKDIYMQAYDQGCKGCTTYRPNDVTGAVLEASQSGQKTDEQASLPLDEPTPRPKDSFEAGGVVYMTRPLDRPGTIPGQTYKLKWPESNHAMYITLNDIIQDGRRRPFEIFINSKNVEHFAWTVALTRMISAVFRRGGDVSFVVEELKAVFDPRGGAWVQGKYVPSLLAAIGDVIETHLIQIGFLPEKQSPDKQNSAHQVMPVGGAPQKTGLQRQCPECGELSLIRSEGCDTCSSCGFSKCG